MKIQTEPLPNLEVVERNAFGDAIGKLALDYVLANVGHFKVRWNKRGNIGHVIRKQRVSTVPLTNTGMLFEQQLPSGYVYALRGVTGSERAQAQA